MRGILGPRHYDLCNCFSIVFHSQHSLRFEHASSLRALHQYSRVVPHCHLTSVTLSGRFRDCYTLTTPFNKTHGFPHTPRAPLALERNARGGMTEGKTERKSEMTDWRSLDPGVVGYHKVSEQTCS